ncbi:MAG TPA: hypothetical protein VFO12_02550 [Sphingomicrobium sp.]|nr:hypothetical protein [Sphingomicrobium sp.]
MLSRIFWISFAGIALIAGMALQDGGIFSLADRTPDHAKAEQTIEARIETAIDRSFDKMHVTGSDGEEIDVPAKTKRAMADAVGRLVKAEADLAMARVGEDDQEAMQAAQARRDQARADVDRLKAEIRDFERAAQGEHDALREEIRRDVGEDIRASVREAVRN